MATSFSLVNPGGSGLFLNDDILGEREIPSCGGLPPARTQHPLEKTGECFSVAPRAASKWGLKLRPQDTGHSP
jgi:hypothetical protein